MEAVRDKGLHLFSVTSDTLAPDKINCDAVIVEPPVPPPSLDRVALQLVGPASGLEPVVASNNYANALLSLKCRALRFITVGTKEVSLLKFIDWVTEHRDVVFNGAPSHVEPQEREVYLSRFTEQVRALRMEGFSKIDEGECISSDEAVRVKPFVKFNELLVGKITSGVRDYYDFKPRCISAGTQIYQAACGPWVSAFQLEIARRWHRGFGVTMAAPMTGETIGDWFSDCLRSDGKFVEGDFVAFDSSQNVLLRSLMVLIHEWFGCPADVLAAQRAKIFKVGVYRRSGLRFEVAGTMASGDPETYVDNCIINGLACLWAFCVSNNLHPRDVLCPAALIEPGCYRDNDCFGVGCQYRCLVAGDDNLTYSSLSCDGVAALIAELGMENEMIVRDDVRDVEFCSGLFWPVLDRGKLRYILGPKVGRLLCKLPWIQRFGKKISSLAEFRGKLLGVRLAVSGIPIISDYVEHGLWLTRDLGRVDVLADKYSMMSNFQFMYEPGVETINMFNRRYGFDPVMMQACRDSILACQLFDRIPSFLVDQLINIDS